MVEIYLLVMIVTFCGFCFLRRYIHVIPFPFCPFDISYVMMISSAMK